MHAPRKILVTGGAGFIGSHVVRALLDRGEHVRVLDTLRTGRRANIEGCACDFVEGSVTDAALVGRLVADSDAVVHLAAMVSVPESVENPQDAFAINVGGTINVLEAARHRPHPPRVVFPSSCSVYGMAERPVHRESHLPEPASPYAITKLAGEHLCRAAAASHHVPTSVLRFFNVYGPRQDPHSPYAAAVAIFARRALDNKPITIYGDGLQTRDLVAIDDVLAAILMGLEGELDGVFNVATGKAVSVRALAERIIALAHSHSSIQYADPRPGEVRESCGDASLLRALGWEPRVSLDDGLLQTIESARE